MVEGLNTTVEIFATHSTNFDVRQQPEKPVNLAKCLIQNCNWNLKKEEILFIIGQKKVEATEIEINEESNLCTGILNFAPIAEDDEKWISCEVNKNNEELLKSNNCFNLDVKHTARSINLELSNVMKSGNATLVLAGTRLGVKCLTDGNPREKTQVTVNGKRMKGRFYNVKKENLIVECRSKSLSTLEPVRVIYLNEPKITKTSANQTTCSADGYPSPKITWLKLPEIGQRVFKMRSESTRTRKWLRKWEYDMISNSSTAFLQQDQIYICNVENEYLSMSKLFRAEKKADSAQTDLIIQPEIRRRKEASKQSPCSNSICNIQMKKSMLVSCSKPYYESSESDSLELVLDGYLLEPNENRRSSKVVAKMELPMKKEGERRAFFQNRLENLALIV
ncbi:Oidioi.mRNA.OKI2018_I69.chr1.g691.t1.cds [Oikopleura dioica]|uniref:Oidioi.mRNA.OKI2018_I69.chr1.g691.t1.cds n=1 Tax=Oikopleura dioica TaxID=34765 RepID=A0ABN7SST5_OIKDI|nr:Oidioi.mRNA.OKI2018_I69.chr1.g691.t1.cds [Oikopleura dioica]